MTRAWGLPQSKALPSCDCLAAVRAEAGEDRALWIRLQALD
jgi:hypothetical protein